MATTDADAMDVWKGTSSILVAVRVRPLNAQEAATSKPVVQVLESTVVSVRDPSFESKDILRQHRAHDRKYAFDHAFGPECGQEAVYNRTTKFLIDGICAGYNATVFAYGATGSGKTYTMLGTERDPGIMILTLQDLYSKIDNISRESLREFRVSLSYVEIYNENIRDLFNPDSGYHELREDPVKGPMVAGVTELEATSTSQVMQLLEQGNRYRTQEATAANKESSRSHAVLTILVEQQDPHGEQKIVGKLNLIDLAGSERASKTKNRGIRLIEGANINRSLLALGNVINALGEKKSSAFVPYRDSKLTRMLKDSLGGNCRTVMIANISAASSTFEETVNTLKYANRAKNIKTKVTRNVLNVNYHISQYEHLITGLREEVSVLKEQLNQAKAAVRSSGLEASTEDTLTPEEAQRVSVLRGRLVRNFRERQRLRKRQMELQGSNVQLNVENSRR